MPRDPDTTPICSPEKVECVHEAVIIVEETAFIDSHTTETNCQCLPSCTHIDYPHEYSMVKLRSDLLHIPEEIEGMGVKLSLLYVELKTVEAPSSELHPEFKNQTYVANNLAVLHLYYNNLHFVTKERDEQYGTVDFVANIGGLLGLCMGLSTISLMEIIYFFTARFYYNLTTARHEDI